MKIKRKYTENKLQSDVVNYIKRTYPNALYNSSFAGMCASSIVQAVMAKNRGCRKGFPDFELIESTNDHLSQKEGKGKRFKGLFIEFKSDGLNIKKPKPNSKLDLETNYPQYYWLKELKRRGYCIAVVNNYEQGCNVIDKYISLDVQLKHKLTANTRVEPLKKTTSEIIVID
jgi:hypothetical protein